MSEEKDKLNDGEWGYFLILIPLLPFIVFGMFFATIGTGLFKLLIADRGFSFLEDRPVAYLYLFYAFVGGAIAIGLYLMFSTGK